MKNFLLKSWLMLVMMLVGVGTSWAEDATMTAGTNGSTATVNNKSAIKVGTSSKGGDMTITVPAGATSLEFYAAAWSGVTGLSLNITPAANVSPTSVSLTADTGISNNSPFTLSGTESSYKFTIALSNITAETKIKLTSSTTKRFVVWGATYSSAADTRTAVNMTGFSATETTIVKGGTTNTSVTNDQNDWTPSYTYTSSNQNVATVSNTGVITAVAKGTAQITASLNIANDDANWKKGATTSKTIDITVNNPSHNYTFISNNTEVSSGSCEEGDAIPFPADPSVDGVTFMGWTTATIDGTQDDAPTMYKSANMGTNNVEYYAVFATAEDGGTAWKLVAGLTNGKEYVFATKNVAGAAYALSYDVANGTAVTIAESGTDKIISGEPANTIIWTAATGWSLTNKGVVTNNKLTINGSTFITNNTGSSNLSWTTNYGLNGQSSSGSTKYYVQCTNTGTFSKSSTSGSTTNRVYAYEKSAGVTYSGYCTTVALDPKPTIVLSATELAEYAGNTNTSITASVSEGEYTGTLSVASSAEAVATASISEGTITINALTAGTATITVTAPAATGFRKNTATITVTVNEKLAHGLAFDADVLNLTVGATEITEPTLSNPNSLPVVYSLVYATPTNEGKVATINSETGKLTLADPSLSTETQGAVTVKASTVGDNSHAAGEVTYNLVVARKVTTTAWSNGGAAVEIDKDEIATLPTASNDGERNLFYESSNTDVATIDNTGTVTFVAYGTTTITAKTSATAEYAATSATYELTFAPRYTVTFNVNGEETVLREETSGAGVVAPEVEPIAGKVFRGWAEDEIDGTTDVAPEFVSTTSLDEDKTLYAVFATKSEGEATNAEGSANFSSSVPTGWTTSGTTTYFSKPVGMKAANAYIANMNISDFKNYASSANTITIGVTSLQNGGTGSKLTVYLVDADGNTVGTGKVITPVNANNANNVTRLTVDFDAANAAGYMVKCTTFDKGILITASDYSINYNPTAYSAYCTTVATSTNVTVTSAGWATYYNAAAYVMPDGLEGRIMADVEGTIKSVVAYEAGEVVPAETGLLLKGEADTYTLNFTNEDGAAAEGNLLKGNLVEGITTGGGDGAKYYKLAVGGQGIGWYYGSAGNTTGAPFTIAANKAYLVINGGNGGNDAPAYISFGDDEDVTIISNVKANISDNDVIYNLNGQRVNANAKGIIIVNGKKMFNK